VWANSMVRCGRTALAWDGEAGGVDAFEATGIAETGAGAAADFAGAAGRRPCHSGLSELATSASAASPRTITTYLFRSGFIWDIRANPRATRVANRDGLR